MRFHESLTTSLILSAMFMTQACTDDGKSDDEAEAETESSTEAESESGSTEAESESGATEAESESGATEAESESSSTEAESESSSTEAETSSTETAGTEETGLASCSDIELAYEALVTMAQCSEDADCKIISGHCSVGLGGCDYAVNVGVSETELDALAEDYVAGDCTQGVCDCAPPPASAICDAGTCVGVG